MTDEDVLLITHHHFDHFDKIAARKLPKDISVVSPTIGIRKLHRLGYRNIFPMLPGQELEIKSIMISAVPVKPAQRFSKLLYKSGLGYLIKFLNINIYISGDTIYCEEIIDFLRKYPINLAIFYGGGALIPVLGRHTLSNLEILLMIEKLNPQRSFVVHLDSLNHCKETRKSLMRMIENSGFANKVVLPLPGEEYVI